MPGLSNRGSLVHPGMQSPNLSKTMKKLLPVVILLVMIINFNAFAQTRKLSGIVTFDEDNLPISGVTILLKGTGTASITNSQGEYTLEIPVENAVLQVYGIGLRSLEVEVGARSIVDVSMSSTKEQPDIMEPLLNGFSRKADSPRMVDAPGIGQAVGANSQLKGADIAYFPVQSFDQALQGRIAGLQVQAASGAPGGAIDVRIRGKAAMGLDDNAPLYIVDGIQVNSGTYTSQGSSNVLASINPNDIESVEVLKDAAATALYGAQSGNGVILITTKQGGARNSGLSLTYQKGIVSPMKLYEVMNARQFAEIKAEAFRNSPGESESRANILYGDPDDRSTLTPFNWVDAVFREAASQDILNLSLSGGNKKTSFFISGSLEGTQGQVIRSKYQRQTFRLNLTHDATDRLQIRTTLSMARQALFGSIANGNFVNGPFQSAFVSQPNSPAFNEDGSFAPYPNNGTGHNFGVNILDYTQEENRESVAAHVIGGLHLDYQILPGLDLRLFGGLDYLDAQSTNERLFSLANFGGFGGTLLVEDRREFNWNTNANLRFSRSFLNDHHVTVNLGLEAKEEITEGNSSTGAGFSNDVIRLLDAAATARAVRGSEGSWTRGGAYAHLLYSFREKYTVEGTLRRDGSSRFGAANRFGTFWSVGASWDLKKESLLAGIQFLGQLKVRASYGVLGNLNGLANFEAISSVVESRQYLGNLGLQLLPENDLLRWQESEHSNFGIDFAFLNHRLFGSVDFFRTDTDQLLEPPLPGDSGAPRVTANDGNVRNTGVEMSLSGVVLDNRKIRWTVGANLTLRENEVTEYIPSGFERIGRFAEGQPIDFIYGLEYVGVNPANGKAMWRDNTGAVKYGGFEAEDASVLGGALPTALGGISNTLSYKGFTLDVFFQFQLGAKGWNADLTNLAASGSSGDNQLVTQLNRWQQPGDITNVPRAYEGEVIDGYHQTLADGFSSYRNGRYVSDAGYVRMKQIMLSYDLPRNLTEKLKLSGARVFVQGHNLLTFTKFDGIDPEVKSYRNEVRGNSWFHNHPVTKLVSAGVTLKF